MVSFTVIASSLALALPYVSTHPLAPRQDAAAGYLAAAFLGDVPSVFFHIASADTPSTFQRLNEGEASLVPTQGTKGARDPYVFFTQDKAKMYILATDLDIGKTDWTTAQTNGSRSIFVWESTDGVNWSQDRLAELMPPIAGYVWAPSATYDLEQDSYAVFWSSRIYDEADTAHTGPSQGPYIYFSHTADFVTFTDPARWNPDTTETVIDQEIQSIGGSSYVRYLSTTDSFVVVDRSDDGLFGTWTRIGVPVNATREGPASYRDILNPQRYYVWEDNYQGAGYECYYTDTFEVPYSPCEPALTPAAMRHGAVVQIDADMYNALAKNVTS